MDPVSLGFYASVCGLLGLAGPKLGAAPIRLGVGALVGVLAVSVLPHVKTLLGVAEAYTTIQP
ncbi:MULTISPECIES: hypothetical protein [Mameliella]|jgi:hypothetical protein|uniref:Uncharacterized protein n=1 Tax=Mameliella alba TaxID=561184 RepID=A0A0B3S4A2_9RHOB|nr:MULTISPECIES: hypothetical protein [Mameliella]MBV6636252.1 hypothetical protein [Mameliella sp.]MCR9274151.1 hypothetical protein [Paracoccaceae bacterium]ODM48713.1 hypothetical protein A9320_03270 [Ruegeria sp. PBVC088]KHQ55087.1 hypothetical protein OA50_00121 [Mameliella alba]MBY6118803.1 hypothetical protein [Mameliella alba]